MSLRSRHWSRDDGIVAAYVRSSGNYYAPRARRLMFIRPLYIVDDWG